MLILYITKEFILFVEGLTALHLATQTRQHNIVNLLIDIGADIDATDARSGRTALFHAAEANDRDTCELLLRRGADANVTNYAGETAVFAANGRKHNQIVALLVKYGAMTCMPTDSVHILG